VAKKELGVCELEEPLICQQFPCPEPGRKGEAKRNAKMLGINNTQKCSNSLGYCKRAREPTLTCYTKRQITEQLIVQSHGSIYGVGP